MTEAELVRERVLQDVGRLSTTPMYADTTLCPDVYAVIEPLLSEVERLRGVVAERDREIERMALRYGIRQVAALEEGE